MLTGDVIPSSGDASVCGFSIAKHMKKVQKHIGYCPQFDALDPLLTPREHLEFFTRLHGLDTLVRDKVSFLFHIILSYFIQLFFKITFYSYFKIVPRVQVLFFFSILMLCWKGCSSIFIKIVTLKIYLEETEENFLLQ